MLLAYGHAEIEWQGVKYCLAPTFANIAKIGTPKEIIDDFKAFISTNSFWYKFSIAINVLNACCDKEIPVELTGEIKFSEWNNKFLYSKPSHGLPMINDVMILAEHCLLHGVCGKSEREESNGEPLEYFNAYEFMELARVHLGLSANEASNMTMTEFVRMMDAKFPEDKNKQIEEDERNDLFNWLEEKNKVH